MSSILKTQPMKHEHFLNVLTASLHNKIQDVGKKKKLLKTATVQALLAELSPPRPPKIERCRSLGDSIKTTVSERDSLSFSIVTLASGILWPSKSRKESLEPLTNKLKIRLNELYKDEPYRKNEEGRKAKGEVAEAYYKLSDIINLKGGSEDFKLFLTLFFNFYECYDSLGPRERLELSSGLTNISRSFSKLCFPECFSEEMDDLLQQQTRIDSNPFLPLEQLLLLIRGFLQEEKKALLEAKEKNIDVSQDMSIHSAMEEAYGGFLPGLGSTLFSASDKISHRESFKKVKRIIIALAGVFFSRRVMKFYEDAPSLMGSRFTNLKNNHPFFAKAHCDILRLFTSSISPLVKRVIDNRKTVLITLLGICSAVIIGSWFSDSKKLESASNQIADVVESILTLNVIKTFLGIRAKEAFVFSMNTLSKQLMSNWHALFVHRVLNGDSSLKCLLEIREFTYSLNGKK
jgi:hypothetical protein